MKKTILVLALLVLPCLAQAKEWVVGVGESIVLKIKDVERIAIGDPNIAEATMVSPDEILINGRQEGVTSFHVWVPKGIMPSKIRVVGDEFPISEINKIEGLELVRPSTLSKIIILRGEVKTKEKALLAEKLARSFGKEVINLIRITEPLLAINKIEGLEMVRAYVSGEILILRGVVAGNPESKLAQSLAEQEYTKVINLIKIDPNLDPKAPEAEEIEKEIEIYRKVIEERKKVIRKGDHQADADKEEIYRLPLFEEEEKE